MAPPPLTIVGAPPPTLSLVTLPSLSDVVSLGGGSMRRLTRQEEAAQLEADTRRHFYSIDVDRKGVILHDDVVELFLRLDHIGALSASKVESELAFFGCRKRHDCLSLEQFRVLYLRLQR